MLRAGRVAVQPTRPLVLLVVAALAAGLVGVAAPPAEASGHTDYRQVVDITFPVADPGTTQYMNDYHHSRGGGTRWHQATDIGAEYGRHVHAAVGGEITWITGLDGNPPSYGYMITIDGDDGRKYHYIHLGRQNGPPSEAYASGLRRGSRVERGQHIGYLGHSGNASASWPHLHFEIWDPRVTNAPYEPHYINPYFSLNDAVARNDHPGNVGGRGPCDPEPGASYTGVHRTSGRSRYSTASTVATRHFDTPSEAVVATGADFPDALSGAALAADRNAPILLTRGGALPVPTRDALSGLGVETVWLLGGERAVSAGVEDEIRGLGIEVNRVHGVDRFETAAKVAELVGAPGGEVVVATGRDFPDAIGAGALAAGPAAKPLLLAESDRLPETTADALADLEVTSATVLGGEKAVSAGVAGALADLGVEIDRLSGSNRYATSAQVAAKARAELGDGEVPLIAASGGDFADALAAGALAARAGGVLVLVHPCDLDRSSAMRDHVRANRSGFGIARVIGGPVAVSELVRSQLSATLRD